MAKNLQHTRIKGWFRLDHALKLPESKRPGVYLLAHLKRVPNSVEPTARRVFYIGETCGQTLRQRVRQFKLSALRDKPAHSGGSTYHRTFAKTRQHELAIAFVAPMDREPLLSYRIRYLERKWLFQYVKRHGEPPCCNRK